MKRVDGLDMIQEYTDDMDAEASEKAENKSMIKDAIRRDNKKATSF